MYNLHVQFANTNLSEQTQRTLTRSQAVAGMVDSWRQINLLDFRFGALEITPSRSTEVKGQGAIVLTGQW
jgi:hypothetical protein